MINFYGVKGLQEKAGSVISAKSDTFAVSKAIGGPLPTKRKENAEKGSSWNCVPCTDWTSSNNKW